MEQHEGSTICGQPGGGAWLAGSRCVKALGLVPDGAGLILGWDCLIFVIPDAFSGQMNF